MKGAPPLPFRRGGCTRRFVGNLRTQFLILLGACGGPGPALVRRVERKGRRVLRFSAYQLRSQRPVYSRVAYVIKRDQLDHAPFPRRVRQARILASGPGRALRMLRTRPLNLENLRARLHDPDTILCLCSTTVVGPGSPATCLQTMGVR